MQEQFIDRSRQAVAAAGAKDLKTDVKRSQRKEKWVWFEVIPE